MSVLSKASDAYGSLNQEGVRVAKLLYERYKTPINLFYSGGIDSEFMVHCFMSAGVPFKLVVCRFKDKLNKHDLDYVDSFLKRYDCEVQFVDLDILSFFSSDEFWKYAEISQGRLPHLYPTMWLADNIKGPVCFGVGEPYFCKTDEGWRFRERESIGAWYRYFVKTKREGTPLFFQYTPEIMLSFLQHPRIKSLVRDEFPGKENSMTSRHVLYSESFPIKERPKYHGFEKIEEQIELLKEQLAERFPERDHHLYWSYSKILDELSQ